MAICKIDKSVTYGRKNLPSTAVSRPSVGTDEQDRPGPGAYLPFSPFTPVSPQITDGETYFKLKNLEVAKKVIMAKKKEIKGVLVTLQVPSVQLPISYSVCR